MDSQKQQRRSPSPGGSSSTSDRLSALFAKRNYELLGELGRGGMGIVYLAKDTKLDRKVALKTLSPERASRENSLRRFEREARTFAQIRHPHIATLYEFEDAGPLQYLALEYIDGYDLESERRRGKKWPQEEAARVIMTVAGALEYTHSKGILHRDIKPGNILIEKGTNRVVLTDFGLAKGRKDETLTASGFAVGTPAYMAPEQISDQFNIRPDGRADIFSLGTVFYEMITATHPFIGADDLKTMRNIVQNQPADLRDLDPGISKSLTRIIKKMLEKNPEDRYSSAKEVHDALEAWMKNRDLRDSEPSSMDTKPSAKPSTEPTEPSAAVPTASPSKIDKNLLIIVGLVAFAMLLVGILVGLWIKSMG